MNKEKFVGSDPHSHKSLTLQEIENKQNNQGALCMLCPFFLPSAIPFISSHKVQSGFGKSCQRAQVLKHVHEATG